MQHCYLLCCLNTGSRDLGQSLARAVVGVRSRTSGDYRHRSDMKMIAKAMMIGSMHLKGMKSLIR